MEIVVHKYGGTSVASIGKIKKIAERVIRDSKKARIIVVVSAMAGETDKLINLADDLSDAPDRREMDLLLSSGERISAALLAIAIKSMGHEAHSFTGRKVGIHTDSVHYNARIKKIKTEKLMNALKTGMIPVIAGFQGISLEAEVTTLGRGGSDLTAVAIAHAVKAHRCLIFKDDVDGIYTADPSIVSKARKLPRVSYEEMLEMSGVGAKVLHSRAVGLGAKFNVPIKVLPTFGRGEGTLIVEEDDKMEREMISGVITDKNQAKITLVGIPDRPGIAAEIFHRISQHNIVVDMIIQNVGERNKTDMSFTVPKGDAHIAGKTTKDIALAIGAEDVKVDTKIGKLSIVGVGMRSDSGVAAKMFKALSDKKINIIMISTSEIKISCIIERGFLKEGANTLHEVFGLGKKRT